MNLVEAGRLSEEQAREYMESLRWPNGPVCPHCQSKAVTRLNGKAHRAGTIQCNVCREQFTVTVGTVMESSKIPLHKDTTRSFIHDDSTPGRTKRACGSTRTRQKAYSHW